MLGARSRGTEELARALAQRGFEAPAARQALSRLQAEGWLQDLAAARSRVRARGVRFGRRRIARELEAAGFAAETVGRALEELDGGQEQEALARAFRKFWRAASNVSPEQRRRRVWRSLLARGFAPDAISAMMRGSDGIDGDSGEVP
ncbi:MAG TPA: regulatory protein RecX [Thermoanaerobaculia bacterium]|nr:regulatory protein RecX [Thermoanaerobaculia bacterium]